MNSPYLVIDRSGNAVDINSTEHTTYRRLGLSPDEIAAKLAYLNDPAPLPMMGNDDAAY